jgi:hypothetical protein
MSAADVAQTAALLMGGDCRGGRRHGSARRTGVHFIESVQKNAPGSKT